MMSRKGAWTDIVDGTPADPQYYCSSDDFKRMLHQDKPSLLVPERAIVYLGFSLPWGPDRELPHPGLGPCPDAKVIHPGSLLCCPKCHLSGFEHRLHEQVALVGYPPPERKRATRPKVVAAPAPPPPPAHGDPKRRHWWETLAWSKTSVNPGPPPSKRTA